MVANKDVLKYMPKGADINAITYGQLFQWAKTIRQRTGQNRFALPASDTGLMHRFLQGFLVPSFTGGFVTKFRSKEAVAAWEYLKQLWQYTHPQSLTYAFMQDPLLSQEVLLGWDHVARLKTALDQRPDDLVAFPVPRGPKARSYMPVLVGHGNPRNAPNPDGAKALIRHLTTLGPQAALLSVSGFFPVVGGRLSKQISPGCSPRRSRPQAAAGEGRRPGAAPDRDRSRGRQLRQGTTATRSRGSSATARTSRPSSGSRASFSTRSSRRRTRPAGHRIRRAGRARCRVA